MGWKASFEKEFMDDFLGMDTPKAQPIVLNLGGSTGAPGNEAWTQKLMATRREVAKAAALQGEGIVAPGSIEPASQTQAGYSSASLLIIGLIVYFMFLRKK